MLLKNDNTQFRIGIIASTHATTIGLTFPYYEYFSKFGEVVLINPLSEVLIKDLDLLVYPGGADIRPDLSQGVPSVYTNRINPVMDYFDERMGVEYFNFMLKEGRPILGICRGFQYLASVMYGAKIKQHVRLPISEPRHKLVETLVDTSGEEGFKINSLHHQTVIFEGLNPDIELKAFSKSHGNLEIFTVPKDRVLGVQYHPEELTGDAGQDYVTTWLENQFRALKDKKVPSSTYLGYNITSLIYKSAEEVPVEKKTSSRRKTSYLYDALTYDGLAATINKLENASSNSLGWVNFEYPDSKPKQEEACVTNEENGLSETTESFDEQAQSDKL